MADHRQVVHGSSVQLPFGHPDGRYVAFAANPDGIQAPLSVINADGTGLRQLADETGVWVENDPAWSPDGTRIAFNRWQRSDAGDWQVRPIAIVDRTGGAAVPVGVAPASEGALIEWSPDGATLSLPGTLVEVFTWGGRPTAPSPDRP